MKQSRGRYHDGQTSRSVEVDVHFYADGDVEIRGEDVALRLRREDLRLSERLGRTPRILSLPDGASCEIPDDDELDALLHPRRQTGA